MQPDDESPLAYLLEFLFRSQWNVVGLILGFLVAYVIWHFVEPIQVRIVLAAISCVLIFFGFMAIGIKKEYQKEDQGK